MRHPACTMAILFALTFAGCGGGGGSGPGGNPNPGAEAQAQQFLQDCVAGDVLHYLVLIEAFSMYMGVNPQAPTLMIGFVNDGTAGIQHTLDLDGDTLTETTMTGQLTFTDTLTGAPAAGFDTNNPPADLAGLLAVVPDGVTMKLTWNLQPGGGPGAPVDTSGSGQLDVEFDNGGVEVASGDALVQDAICNTMFEFDNVTPADLGGAQPVMLSTFDADDGTDQPTGSVTMDGSDTAAMSITWNTQTFPFELSLTSGLVTDPTP